MAIIGLKEIFGLMAMITDDGGNIAVTQVLASDSELVKIVVTQFWTLCYTVCFTVCYKVALRGPRASENSCCHGLSLSTIPQPTVWLMSKCNTHCVLYAAVKRTLYIQCSAVYQPLYGGPVKGVS